MTTAPATIVPRPTQPRPSLAGPLVLITLGVVFLLANGGYITRDIWAHLGQIWPVVLVLIGVDLIIRPRSLAVALIAEIALIAAAVVYAVAARRSSPASRTSTRASRGPARVSLGST